MKFRVTLDACVAGNPLKAWHGSTGEDDAVNVPDDVWEAQTHDYDDLDAAKAFIVGLHPQTSTHVVLATVEGDVVVVLFNKDAGDDLDLAAPGVVPASLEPDPLPEGAVPEAPPLLPSQSGGKK